MKARDTFVDLAGETVHLVETGSPDGTPLLLSSGLGGAWFDWRPVVEMLPGHYRVICFDRPGLGLSRPSDRPHSLRAEIRLLTALADWVGSPVTVVAHSVAAFHAEALARIEPDLVHGLVLVDPSYEPGLRSIVRLSAVMAPLNRQAGRVLELTRISRVLGPAARAFVLRNVAQRDDPIEAETVRKVYGKGSVISTVMAENTAYREMAGDLSRLRGRRPFPPIPLVVLTALGDVTDERKARGWSDGHRELAEMSPYGRQIELADSLHMVQVDRPDAVVTAIADIFAIFAGPGPVP